MNLRKALDRARADRPTPPWKDRYGFTWAPQTELEQPSATASHRSTRNVERSTSICPQRCRITALPFRTSIIQINYYKVLRTQLRQFSKQNNWNSIMVTSANPGEGKTVTSINLAATFAREYNKTALLVDADLRMQSIHRYLGYDSPLGLLDYLEGKAAIGDIITWPSIDKLTIISGDRVVEDSSELIGSPRMKALVEELKTSL
jgi:protein-tyrosine kinase